MALQHSPSIVTSGLMLCYDAANPRSYPGSGTTIYDISGNGYNGTLTNGVSYSSSNRGCLSFDGVDDYVSFANPLNQSNLTQVWTVQAWISVTSATTQTIIGGLNSGVHASWYSAGSLLYLNGGANDYYMYGSSVLSAGWVGLTYRFQNSTGTRTIYNGTNNISTGGPNNTSTPGGQSSTFTLGGGSGYLQGTVGPVLIYNRMITDAELTQNYNAYRGRYGV